jgi:hypothetical protein
MTRTRARLWAGTRAVGSLFSRRSFRLTLLVVGVGAAPLVVLPVMRTGGVDALDTITVFSVLVPWSFVASGFVAWDRRPENRIGALLMLLGFWWIAGRLMGPPTTSSSLVNSVGIVWRLAWVVGFVFVLLSFPRGRLSTLADKVLIGLVFVAGVPLQILWLLFLELQDPPNAFLVWPSKSTADAIDTSQRVIWLAAALALVTMLATRWIRAGRPRRRELAPVLAGAITVLAFSALVIVQKLRPVPAELLWGVFAAYTAVPLALLASILRARLARSAVGDLFLELHANPAPQDLRNALARALGDPSLTLAYWLPDYESYADLDGRPVELPDDGDQATTLIEHEGAHVAALIHDASLKAEPELLDAAAAAAGIAAPSPEATGSRADTLPPVGSSVTTSPVARSGSSRRAPSSPVSNSARSGGTAAVSAGGASACAASRSSSVSPVGDAMSRVLRRSSERSISAHLLTFSFCVSRPPAARVSSSGGGSSSPSSSANRARKCTIAWRRSSVPASPAVARVEIACAAR